MTARSALRGRSIENRNNSLDEPDRSRRRGPNAKISQEAWIKVEGLSFDLQCENTMSYLYQINEESRTLTTDFYIIHINLIKMHAQL